MRYRKSPLAPSRSSQPNPKCSFRGSCPYSVFPTTESYLPRRVPNSSGYVLRPRGFAPPRRFCSPRSLPSLFHPGPAHGVLPSRLLSLRQCRASSSNAAALFELIRPLGPPDSRSGPITPRRSHADDWCLVSPIRADAPLGFLPFEVSCLLRWPLHSGTPSPLAILRLGRKLT